MVGPGLAGVTHKRIFRVRTASFAVRPASFRQRINIEREKEFALVGSIYKGKVTRVLPGMQSAFVDIGLDGDAFLYVSDVFENLEDYEHGHPSEQHISAPAVPATNGSTVELLPGE